MKTHIFLPSLLVLFIGPGISSAAIAGLQFDPAMISGDPSAVADLSRFSSDGAQLPGEYLVDIYLNGHNEATRMMRFVSLSDNSVSAPYVHDNTGLMACLTAGDLSAMGVKVSAFPELITRSAGECVAPGRYIPQAWTAFDFQKMQLDISIPQFAMHNRPQGWIPAEQWEEGVNAALLSWHFSGSESQGRFANSNSQFLHLTSGINLGAWRLRDNSTWSREENGYRRRQRWQHLNSYLQRAVIPLRSELTIGDGTTEGDIFDAVSFRGAQLTTDESMYPETLSGFAPVIRGTASGSAEVSIRQSGHEIYRTNVAAGAFVIDDLFPLSSGGDLDVMVTEADGGVKIFTVPYSSVPVLQRQGRMHYGITAGRYRNTSSYDDPVFVQGTLLWGLPHNVTVYGGTQLAEKYRSAALGAGINMGRWGAVSADITHADSQLADGVHHQGQSLRFLYGRSLIATGTTFQLVGYRYSTRGFYTLDDVALKGMTGWTTDTGTEVDAAGRQLKRDWSTYYNLYSNRRERLQANISQRLGELGSLNLTASRQSYWDNTAATASLRLGFSSSLGDVSYSIAYGYTRYSGQPRADKTLWLGLSVPLGRNIWAGFNSSQNSEGYLSHQAGINGSALDKENLNWSLSQGYGQRDGPSGDASVDYSGAYGNAAVGYSYSRNYRQWRYGVSGGAALHGEGVTLGQPLGATNILIAAPGAAGVPVMNGTGIETDWRGYTLLPYASEYRTNQVVLDVSRLDDHTEIDRAITRVVPTRGALVRVDFQARNGVRALLTLMHNGKPLPFGTMLNVIDGTSGLVGDDGLAYLSGLTLSGEIQAQWGKRPEQKCSARYTLPATALKTALSQARLVCQ